MTKQMYIIEYNSAHWCGASHQCVVWAKSAEQAEDLAGLFMEEHLRELYSDEYNVDYDEDEGLYGEYDDESAYQVVSVEPFGPAHDCWEYFQDPTQAEFYPQIGTPE